MDRAHPLLIVAALAAAPLPAHADFYTIEGRFQCLDRPGALCFDAAIPHGPSLLSEPAAPPAAPAATASAAPALSPTRAAVAKAPIEPVLAIAERIKEGHPAEDDVATLRRAADAGDSRALELLAWCALRGIGTAPDAMAAYDLYGRAAAESVPHAAENQQLVFERSLTSDERQSVLERVARRARTNVITTAELPAVPQAAADRAADRD